MSYTVTDYLLDRVAELGARRVFGVPGDFTLALLDHVEAHDALGWVGCANELGAGYAADGYARMAGIGVLCTTFGVGELSAVNALAGSYAEHVPVVHVVGSPAADAQAAHRVLHHSLGDGEFGHFLRMHAEVTCAQAALTAQTACAEIDRVLLEVRERRLPGYLLLPTDVGEAQVDPPAAPLPDHLDLTDAAALAGFRDAAGALLAGTRPTVLADVLVARMGAVDALRGLIAAGGLDYSSLLWGRRVVDESGAGYVGVYAGAASTPRAKDAVEGTAALLSIGVQFTDLTSGFFSQRIDTARLVEVGPGAAAVAGRVFAPVEMADALAVLTELVADPTHPEPAPAPPRVPDAPDDHHDADPLGQATLWDLVCDAIRPGDLVLADQGTSFYGMGGHRLPHDVVFVGQPLWASIGYTLPALLGSALAAPHRRPVLLIGDGAAQLTIAELGTILRHGLAPLIVLVNNDGYTVERAIHGPDAAYNDIAGWDWTALPAAFGRGIASRTARATTVGELRAALSDAAAHPEQLSLVEAVVPRLDVPPLLATIAAAAAAANARAAD